MPKTTLPTVVAGEAPEEAPMDDDHTDNANNNPAAIKESRQIAKGHFLALGAMLLFVLAAVAIGLGLGLRKECDNEDAQQAYEVSLFVFNDGPAIETLDGGTFWQGSGGTTLTVRIGEEFPNAFVPFTFGDDGWLDSAIRIRRIHRDSSSADLQVYRHNGREMDKLLGFWHDVGSLSEPECEPAVQKVDLWEVPMGKESDRFDLGLCRVKRLVLGDDGDDDPQQSLSPSVIEMAFSGTVKVVPV
jgi:hypothetical protein